jgi:hypothetical protein
VNSGAFGGRLFVFRSMSLTTHLTTTDSIARITSRAPHIACTAVAFPPNRYNQDEVARELTTFTDPEFMRFARTTGVDQRSLALPLQRHPMRSFQ